MLFSAILLSGFLAGLSSVSAVPVAGLHQVDTASLRARGPDARIHARGRSLKKNSWTMLILDFCESRRVSFAICYQSVSTIAILLGIGDTDASLIL